MKEIVSIALIIAWAITGVLLAKSNKDEEYQRELIKKEVAEWRIDKEGNREFYIFSRDEILKANEVEK